MVQETGTNQALETFLEDHQCIEAMPESSIKILKLIQDPNIGMEQLVRLTRQDTAIAAKVIKTVNSAAYSLNQRMTRLDRATAYMGYNAVKEIVVSSAVASMCRPVVIGKYATRDLWDPQRRGCGAVAGVCGAVAGH